MRNLIPKGGSDDFQTPSYVAKKIVEHLVQNYHIQESTRVLEPCAGNGNFVSEIEKFVDKTNIHTTEIKRGFDFFHLSKNNKYDWIITNPPWSKARPFLNHSMDLAPNICFLITINHILALKARLRDMDEKGFWPTEILLLDTPKEFPQSGFQLCACIIQKNENYSKQISFTKIKT